MRRKAREQEETSDIPEVWGDLLGLLGVTETYDDLLRQPDAGATCRDLDRELGALTRELGVPPGLARG